MYILSGVYVHNHLDGIAYKKSVPLFSLVYLAEGSSFLFMLGNGN